MGGWRNGWGTSAPRALTLMWVHTINCSPLPFSAPTRFRSVGSVAATLMCAHTIGLAPTPLSASRRFRSVGSVAATLMCVHTIGRAPSPFSASRRFRSVGSVAATLGTPSNGGGGDTSRAAATLRFCALPSSTHVPAAVATPAAPPPRMPSGSSHTSTRAMNAAGSWLRMASQSTW
eukprot:212426-Chlamydomonas_euryale.AAC.1